MKQPSLWRFSAEVRPEAEAAAMEWITAELDAGASSYTDAETGRVWVSVYLPRKSADAEPLDSRLRAELAAAFGAEVVRSAGWRRLRAKNWAESWKRHFRPLRIGSQLLIRPSWSRRKARPGQKLIVLDPGLSFGTGHHATTSFCLAQVAAQRLRGARQSFLDIGTGSGILAIAAAKLGYSPIEAFDFDPESIRVARANARRNHVFAKIRLRQADLTELPPARQKYDLVCANLISTLLLDEQRRILDRLAPGGALILAGILADEFDSVRRHYERAGLKFFRGRSQKEWRSGAFKRQAAAGRS